ncbi:hypothetical protein O0L34_g10005 [Tuta absoluta]|nr:hypothetical protein O0L34_g10005 [Tuta absoluta]
MADEDFGTGIILFTLWYLGIAYNYYMGDMPASEIGCSESCAASVDGEPRRPPPGAQAAPPPPAQAAPVQPAPVQATPVHEPEPEREPESEPEEDGGAGDEGYED